MATAIEYVLYRHVGDGKYEVCRSMNSAVIDGLQAEYEKKGETTSVETKTVYCETQSTCHAEA